MIPGSVCRRMARGCSIVLSLTWLSFTIATQVPLVDQIRVSPHANESRYYHFDRKIERVAVIGAGPAGLQHASAFIDAGFTVRMFERAPMPGGEWLYTDKVPIDAQFP